MDSQANEPTIGRIEVFALDCSNPDELARFYRAIVGGDIVAHPDGGWVEVHTTTGKIAFQQIDHHRRPTWPDGEIPQQAHLDVAVDDLAAGEIAVLGLGAVKAAEQPAPSDFRVFIDPEGHPFCLVQAQVKVLP